MVPNEEETEKDWVKEFKEQKASGDENPDHVDNADDLHEIQAADDLSEPDAEAGDLAPTEATKANEKDSADEPLQNKNEGSVQPEPPEA
jgi:hypothetical protein